MEQILLPIYRTLQSKLKDLENYCDPAVWYLQQGQTTLVFLTYF